MMIQTRYTFCSDPDALLAASPRVTTAERGYFKEILGNGQRKEGHFQCALETRLALPALDWNQLYNLAPSDSKM